jgi:hypothetical protein
MFSLTSCLVMINENNYRGLTSRDLEYFQKFQPDSFNQNADSNSLIIYEINTPQLKSITAKNKFTWVHLWRPWCSAEKCQNIGFFSQAAGRFHQTGLMFLLLSESYDINAIRKAVQNSNFHDRIYILEDSYYGHKIDIARERFIDGIMNNARITPGKYYDDFIFRDTLLVFASKDITIETLDSLMTLLPQNF